MDNSNQNLIKERLNSILNKKPEEQNLDGNKSNSNNFSPFPTQQEMNKISTEMKNIKLEFEKASINTPEKDKFSSFIKQANDMFTNYEKQLNYYKKKLSMFNPNELEMKLTNWEKIKIFFLVLLIK